MRVRLTPAAAGDLLALGRRFGALGCGADFRLCLGEMLARLGHEADDFPRAHRFVRRAVLRRYPCAVYFLVEDEAVVVLGAFSYLRG